MLRYLIGLIPVNNTTLFPVKTFLINIAGCFLIGILAALALKNMPINPRLMLFLKVGLCGGFTTFSTFALETTELVQGSHIGIAVIYVVLSILIGVGCVFAAELIIGK